MIYDIRHVTTYAYAAPVPFAHHGLHLLPVDRPGLRVLKADIRIEPRVTERRDGRDFFGNGFSIVAIDEPHDRLVVTLTARVERNPPPASLLERAGDLAEVREDAAASLDLSAASPVHFLFASRRVPLDPQIRAYAAESFPPGLPVAEGALHLARRIKRDFVYEPGATDADTPPAVSFAMRRGVCQDFAHVMIAGLRGLGLPVAYVGGYLRTVPPPGRPRLQGADATHAWVSVWCGEAAGWVGVDPTNGVAAGADHIELAIGRDYADVAPIEGVILTSGAQQLGVAVDVIPLTAI
ncbi:transglutaminase family protein [Segnochrobactrum spirostomi]|uniref:Transglutaminase family protein n=1 Tax=Segnochrobactrum spirostomi TaxID=2608987 RepID=A0A6A7Y6M3_9HYPH|nr:transglutaminase family protein [Segnochrobactrum spirostomi]MQT13708.1 transglutaminase family protein [Segnochrobactrum spirostomi]